jgi:hypothetical protein
VKVALPVVRGLHGSQTGTTRRFKVGDFKTEFNGLGVLRTDIRTVPGRRRGDRIGGRMSASVKVFGPDAMSDLESAMRSKADLEVIRSPSCAERRRCSSLN